MIPPFIRRKRRLPSPLTWQRLALIVTAVVGVIR